MKRYIRESVTRMKAYVPGEQPNDPEIIKLNTNENPYPPSPAVTEVLQSLDATTLRRYPDPVCRGIRDRLASLHGLSVDHIIVGNGSDELLALCTRAYVENDGTIAAFEPSYSLYPVLSSIRDVEYIRVPWSADSAWTIPEEIASRTDLFFVTTPNAPTGMPLSLNAMRSICEAVKGVVVFDEAYGEFSDNSAVPLMNEFENVLVMRTLSKSFSLAGIRLGYVLGSQALIEALYCIKDSYNVNQLSQIVAEAALDDPDWMQANVARICKTRERLREDLSSRGFEVAPSDANFLWAKPPAGASARALYEKLRENRILVRYFDHEGVDDHVRITIGTDEEIDSLIRALATCGGV